MRQALAAVLLLATPLVDTTTVPSARARDSRATVLQRAQVWEATNVSSADLLNGPAGRGAFKPGEIVNCDYLKRTFAGHSPKFACRLANGDAVKVKFGGTNGEVYGEVLATRLLWALGFGADRMYSVNVICRHCPSGLGGIARPNGDQRFAPAAIEREFDAAAWTGEGGSGWAWPELDLLDPAHGGAPVEQRDALTLLAVFLQHTDNKPEQQRIVCLDQAREERSCRRPFLMLNDVGMTFGRANWTNADPPGSVNLAEWRKVPVWRDATGCVGNLPRSFSGTLNNPIISEKGRRFLASLLAQLSDRQIRDLFQAARVDQRLREPGRALSGFATADEWADAFRDKRSQIASRRCS